jgi:hypothetical protein
MGAPAQLTSPVPGVTLPGSSVTFQWSAGTNVEEYCLHLNTQPGDPDDPSATRIYASGHMASTTLTVSKVPMNGTPIYAILGSEYNGSWHYVTYSFTEAPSATVPALSASTANLAFGNDPVNTATAQTVTLSSTGTAAVTVSSASIAGSGFTVSGATLPLTLNPGQTAALSVQFAPTAAGAGSGSLTFTSNSSTGPSTVVSLSGTGVPVLTGIICASGSMTGAGTDSCTVSLNTAAASGGFAVSLASNNAAVKVPASITVTAGATSASFTATASSVTTATSVSLTAAAGGATQSFALQLGASTSSLSVGASTIAFGDVNLNSPATQSVTLTATGTTSVTVSAATVAGTGFSLAGATLPITLAPNQSTTLSVQFDPTAAASDIGTLTIVSSSSSNPSYVVGLTGTGQSTAYEVNLSWDAPNGSSDPVAGYNVYRAPSGSTSYQQINPSQVSETAFQDTSVQTGQTYNYIVESVDGEGNISAPSNMASVVVP